MKKTIAATITMLFLTTIVYASEINLAYIRSHYDKAAEDEKLCRLLLEELSKKNGHSVYLGYLGAFQTIWAKHVKSPAAKLRTFTAGKNNIEKAVAAEPDNIELRFIRLSIQKNCPPLLGYRADIDKDRLFIKNNLHTITSESLRKMCIALIRINVL